MIASWNGYRVAEVPVAWKDVELATAFCDAVGRTLVRRNAVVVVLLSGLSF